MLNYFKFLLGGSKFWLGRSMSEAHAQLQIPEAHFDLYYKNFTTTLKQMKVPIKVMQTLMKKVNELRDEIIFTGEPALKEEVSVSLFTVLGEEQGI